MDKSPDAYRTISEVADELGLPQHVLRFWETRFPQIKPLKRGGGRRFYRPDDVDLVRGIQTLLYSEGYTIKGVQRILKEDGVKPVQMVGRGSALSGERPDAEEPDDDVFTADEMLSDDDAPTSLRATRDEPQPNLKTEQREPVFAVTPEEGGNHISAPDMHVPKSTERSPRNNRVNASQQAALAVAASELQECARLVELLREKA